MAQRPRVYMRIRPPLGGPGPAEERLFTCVPGSGVVRYRKERKGKTLNKHARFDAVFVEDTPQAEIFEKVGREAIQLAQWGFSSSIIMYGPSGSGKTYTMDGDLADASGAGLVPRVFQEVFALGGTRRDFAVSLQMVQLYRERLEDLGVDAQGAAVTGSRGKAVEMKGSTENAELTASRHAVSTYDEALDHYVKASGRRAVGDNAHNKVSSRSHTMLVVTFEWTDAAAEASGAATRSKGVLNLVDLAGSEKLDKLPVGLRQEEFLTITKNLTHLSACVDIMVKNAQYPDPSARRHVPVRGSSLTHLLAPCFSGKGAMSLVITSSNRPADIRDADASIEFGKRCLQLPLELKRLGVSIVAGADQLVRDMKEARREVEAAMLALPPLEQEEEDDEKQAMQAELTALRAQLAPAEKTAEDSLAAAQAPRAGRPELDEDRLKLLVERRLAAKAAVEGEEATVRKILGRKANVKDTLDELKAKSCGRPRSPSRAAPPPSRRLLAQAEELEACEGELTTQLSCEKAKLAMTRDSELMAQRELEGFLDGAAVADGSRSTSWAKLAALVETIESDWFEKHQLRAKLAALEAQLGQLEDPVEASLRSARALARGAGAGADATPILETLEEDLASYEQLHSTDELDLAFQGLPGTSHTVINLITLYPAWKARFREMGGVARCMGYLKTTPYASTHQNLASCLARVLDAEGIEVAHSLGLVDEVRKAVEGTEASPGLLDKTCSDTRRRTYLDLIAVLARHAPCQAQLLDPKGGVVDRERGLMSVVSVLYELAQYPVQETQASAIRALGELSYVPEDRPPPEGVEASISSRVLKVVLSTLQTNYSDACREAAAQSLTRMCQGYCKPWAIAELLKLKAAELLYCEITGPNRASESVKHVKYALLLIMDGQPAMSGPGFENLRSTLLVAVASASATALVASGEESRSIQGKTADVPYFGQAVTGSWVVTPSGFSAGGPQLCSTFYANPMYMIRFRNPRAERARVAVVLLDVDGAEKHRVGSNAERTKERVVFLNMKLTSCGEVAQKEAEDYPDKLSSLQAMVSRGLKPFIPFSAGKSAETASSLENSMCHELPTDDIGLLTAYTRVPMQQARYALGVFSDCDMELCSFGQDAWQRDVFTGRWGSPALLGYDHPSWRDAPQFRVVNTGSRASQMCFVLSYKQPDDEMNVRHLKNEEDDESGGEDASQQLPYLEMRLFDVSAQPTHRHVGPCRPAVERTRFLNKVFVTLRAEVPPGRVYALSLARDFDCLGRETPPPPLLERAEQYRLQVLSESAAAQVRPFGEEGEWHAFATHAARAEAKATRPFVLRLPEGDVEHVVHLVARSTKTQEVYTRLRMRRPGDAPIWAEGQTKKSPFMNGEAHACFKLAGGGDWEVSLEVHPDSPEGFLYHVFGYSKFSPATTTASPASGAPPDVPFADAEESAFPEEIAFLQDASIGRRGRAARPSEQVCVEESLLEARAADDDEGSDKRVLVRHAYLERLHGEVMRLRQKTPSQATSAPHASAAPHARKEELDRLAADLESRERELQRRLKETEARESEELKEVLENFQKSQEKLQGEAPEVGAEGEEA